MKFKLKHHPKGSGETCFPYFLLFEKGTTEEEKRSGTPKGGWDSSTNKNSTANKGKSEKRSTCPKEDGSNSSTVRKKEGTTSP